MFFRQIFKTNFCKSEAGFTFIEVLIAISLMGVVAMGMMQMMSNQTKETKSLGEKLASLGLEKQLISTLADGSVCQYMIADAGQAANRDTNQINATDTTTLAASIIKFHYIPATANAAVTAKAVEVGKLASENSNSLRVALFGDTPSGITLKDFTGTGTPAINPPYSAKMVINFDPESSVRQTKALIFPVVVSATLAGATATLAGCAMATPVLPTIPPVTSEIACNAGSVGQSALGVITATAQDTSSGGWFSSSQLLTCSCVFGNWGPFNLPGYRWRSSTNAQCQ